jgi:hypothetical protein
VPNDRPDTGVSRSSNPDVLDGARINGNIGGFPLTLEFVGLPDDGLRDMKVLTADRGAPDIPKAVAKIGFKTRDAVA